MRILATPDGRFECQPDNGEEKKRLQGFAERLTPVRALPCFPEKEVGSAARDCVLGPEALRSKYLRGA